MPSGRIADYLGVGLAADRPVAATIAAQTFTSVLALYFSTDTDELSMLDTSGTPAWVTVTVGPGVYQPLSSNLTAYAGGDTPSAFTLGIVDSANAAAWRTAIGAGTSTVTPSALTKADDTNVTLTLGGTASTALLQAVSITAGWAGTLSVARGGTGSATAAGARVNLGAAASGSNSDITAINSLTGDVTWTAGGSINVASSQMRLNNVVASGNSFIAFNPIVTDAVSNSSFRFFRDVNTSGLVFIDIHRADGTSGVNHRLYARGGDSYLCSNTGNLGVGNNAPSEKLDVTGNIKASNALIPGSFTISTLPTAVAGGIITVSNLGGGSRQLESDGTAWRRIGAESYQARATDAAAAFTYTYLTSATTQRLTAAITVNRTVTLTAGAPSGARARFVRDVAATGAFNWAIGSLKNLAPGTWCEIESDGTNWFLATNGSL